MKLSSFAINIKQRLGFVKLNEKIASLKGENQMLSFSEKIKKRRETLQLTQQDLSNLVGVSKRSIAAYETTNTRPRGRVAQKLAKALKVSMDYLLRDEISDPTQGLEKDFYVEQARQRFGSKGAMELEELLEQNLALFAGGDLEQEAKDAFFEAVMKAYLECKEASRRKFGKKNKANN